MHFRPLIAAICALAQPALAQDTPPVVGRVLPGWIQADGSRVAGVQLDLAPGWKTYWRSPGDAGIPPIFDWDGSENLGGVAVHWPAPLVFDQNGMRSFGYADTVVLPVVIAPQVPGAPVDVRLALNIGVCSTICVPLDLSLTATLADNTTRPTPRIASALAQRPFTAAEAGVETVRCDVAPTADGLEVEAHVVMPHSGGTEVAVIEPGVPDVWVSEAQTRRDGTSLVATAEMIHVSGAPFALDRSQIRLTVLGTSHAVDIMGCLAN